MAEPSANLLRGAPIAAAIRASVSDALKQHGVVPHLVNVIVGGDETSLSYLGAIDKLAGKLGLLSSRHVLPADADEDAIVAAVEGLGADPGVHGLMIQFPLPRGVDARRVARAVPPLKDVDGLTIESLGACFSGETRHTAPATAAAVIELLLSEPACDPAGKEVCVIGRSLVVGRPVAAMLASSAQGGNATVSMCHRGTADTPAHARRADILVVAAGVKHLVQRDWVKPGAVVVDVGTHAEPTDTGWTVSGDVHPDVAEVAGWLTPVPGGVGPVTNAVLMRHVAAAALPDVFEPAW